MHRDKPASPIRHDLLPAVRLDLHHAGIVDEDGDATKPGARGSGDLIDRGVVRLPGSLNERQLAEAARETRPDLRVLCTTGYTQAIVRHDTHDVGVELLVKPLTRTAPAAKIRPML